MRHIYFLLFNLIFIVSFNGQNIVSEALKDKNGNLWFSIPDRGIYRYDTRLKGSTVQSKSFVNFTKETVGLNTHLIACIYEDREGNLWFSTKDGACKYDGKNFSNIVLPLSDSTGMDPRKYYLLSQMPRQVTKMLQDRAGNFWFVTTNNGVYRYDPKRNDSIGKDKAFVNFLAEETLQCIAEDTAGTILVGSWNQGGVYRFDGKVFNHFDGFSDAMIYCMLKDKAGNVWIGTRNFGVDRYDGKKIINFSQKDGLMSKDVCSIFEDTKGNLWFGSDFNKLISKRGDAFCYDGKSFINITEKESSIKFKDYDVHSIVEDNDGNIWLGSRNGLLLRYNASLNESAGQGKSFTDFSQELPK